MTTFSAEDNINCDYKYFIYLSTFLRLIRLVDTSKCGEWRHFCLETVQGRWPWRRTLLFLVCVTHSEPINSITALFIVCYVTNVWPFFDRDWLSPDVSPLWVKYDFIISFTSTFQTRTEELSRNSSHNCLRDRHTGLVDKLFPIFDNVPSNIPRSLCESKLGPVPFSCLKWRICEFHYYWFFKLIVAEVLTQQLTYLRILHKHEERVFYRDFRTRQRS